MNEIADWTGLIVSVKRDLELARVRVKALKSIILTFENLRRQRVPFPGSNVMPTLHAALDPAELALYKEALSDDAVAKGRNEHCKSDTREKAGVR